MISGYYRVNYDPENWELLTKQLHQQPNKIHPLNRAQLLDDAISLAIDDKISFSIPMNLSKYLVHENDLIPWQVAFQKFYHLWSKFEATYVGAHLKVRAMQKATIIGLKRALLLLPIIRGDQKVLPT